MQQVLFPILQQVYLIRFFTLSQLDMEQKIPAFFRTDNSIIKWTGVGKYSWVLKEPYLESEITLLNLYEPL